MKASQTVIFLENKLRQSNFLAMGIFIFSISIASSCNKPDMPMSMSREPVIYVENNDFHDNKNAVLAFRINEEGKMKALPGSPFLTGGAGLGNPSQILGPDDQETPIIISADGKYLLAVNGGSNTIAVFEIHDDGSISAVAGSPFPSNGETPVSLAQKNNFIFVVNKSQNPLQKVTMKPNYSTLMISADGKLSMVPGGKFETTEGTSPAQALVSRDQKFLFGVDFLGFMIDPPVGTLRSFIINNAGILTPAAGTPQALPGNTGGALGLWQHPKDNTLYVGFPVASRIGVYEINPTSGNLSYSKSVEAGAAACWIRTNSQGDRMYVLNSAEATVGVYNISNSLNPVIMAKLKLKKSGPVFGPMNAATSEPFNLTFSPSGKILYVVSQHANTDFSIGNYNYFHSLQVMTDGTLSELMEPAEIPVPANFRPQGIVVK